MSQLSVALGRVIRTSRKSAGLSQEALALQAKVDRSYVGRIERGEANITIELLYQLADVIGVTPDALLPSQDSIDE
ncbi:XRE family transcriptional regulator [Alteromonas sp. KS69]|jgi:transcriptional regulator with XRE-family HTH domain|uniref:helix-turn-helix domain-containing protein n=1 Tax=Alteromonas TaxID=226 RepID=UPI00066E86CE|nr:MULTISPECIES: helix-turn-helix transcriptional regulator [Alteromonas]RUP81570.1 XRE family transcriptional regulator [Alteromonas sp. KS69]CAI3957865.1 Helix-turn-helix [Alteromonas macleodii]VTP52832.1 Helix-turn-helix [Alteromonas macleodii]|tara:strand:- start:878 stop:1105 length:228 start_codon:yes stop_codon:yes gene_type:complete